MADIVYDLAADTAKFEAGMLNAAAGLEKFANASREDHTSGLVRKLIAIENETKQLAGEFSAAELAVAKFARQDGVTPEMIARLKQAHVQLESTRKQQEANAVTEKASREAVTSHNLQQQKLIDQYTRTRERREDAHVARQISLSQAASQVKTSLMSREQILAAEIHRLQELRNRGLLTELQLQQAIANTRVQLRNAGGGANAGALMAGMVAQQGAIGVQDAVSGFQTNGWGGAIMSGANNAIQMASLVNPMAGTVVALSAAAVQLGIAWSKTKDSAEESAKAFKAAEEAGKAAAEAESARSKELANSRTGGTRESILERAKSFEQDVTREHAFIQEQEGILLAGQQRGDNLQDPRVQAQRKAILDEIAKAEERARQAEWTRQSLVLSAADAPSEPILEEAEALDILRQAQEETAAAARKAADEEKRQREELLDVLRQEQEIQKQLAAQEAAAAKAVKESLMTNQQRADLEADRLLKMEAKGLLNRDEVTGSMRKYLEGMSAPPTIAQGLVKGSVEEVRARRMDEARSEQKQMIDKQVETTLAIREQTAVMREFKDKYEAPETGSEA